MTSNYPQPQKTPVNEDVIHAVRRILQLAADEGVSIAPALSRGLAEALTPQRAGASACTNAVATLREATDKTDDTKCPTQCSASREHDDKANMANKAGASACTEPEIRTFITNKRFKSRKC